MINIKSNKGSSVVTAPLVIVISLFLFALLTIFCVNYLMSFVWYEKLSAQSLKYIFIMEEYGYLTPSEKTALTDDLNSAGFDTSNVSVSATDIPAGYGEPIFLNISYKYKMMLPVLNSSSLSTTKQESTVEMNIRKQSISKR